jgi:phosphate transport system substrate-binding protein
MNKKIVLAFWVFCFSFCLMTFFYCDSRGRDQDLPVKKLIKVGGSESELNLIRFFSNEFKKKNPDVSFEIKGGGSGLGIHALLFGKLDIASSSRAVNESEVAKANLYGKRFSPIIIGLDVIAIILNSGVGIDSLSLTQLGKIFDGTYTNWNQLGGLDLPIKAYGRNFNSGTYHYIKERLLIGKYDKNM